MHLPTLQRLQAARDAYGRPMRVNSFYRCNAYNARLGGSPLNHPMGWAVDISARTDRDRRDLLRALRGAGFKGFGLYRTFIHADTRRERLWFGRGGEGTWKPILSD